MSESGLTLGFGDFKSEVGFILGYGTTAGSWSVAQEAEIELIVNTAYRRTLYPPAMQGVPVGYEWSFLRPTTTLAIVADDGDYDLPDSYGRIIGGFHYAADQHKAMIRQVPLAQLLDMRSTSDMNGYPNFFATRWKSSDGTDGQRQEALFYPEPDAAYTLYYSFDANTEPLSDVRPYPLGGMQLSELYKESCLAVAEARNEDTQGIHTQLFQSLLVDQIARDMKRGSGQNYGHMGAPSGLDDVVEWRRGNELHSGAYSIQYSGEYV